MKNDFFRKLTVKFTRAQENDLIKDFEKRASRAQDMKSSVGFPKNGTFQQEIVYSLQNISAVNTFYTLRMIFRPISADFYF